MILHQSGQNTTRFAQVAHEWWSWRNGICVLSFAYAHGLAVDDGACIKNGKNWQWSGVDGARSPGGTGCKHVKESWRSEWENSLVDS